MQAPILYSLVFFFLSNSSCRGWLEICRGPTLPHQWLVIAAAGFDIGCIIDRPLDALGPVGRDSWELKKETGTIAMNMNFLMQSGMVFAHINSSCSAASRETIPH